MIETDLQFDPALLSLAQRVLERRGFLVREGALRGSIQRTMAPRRERRLRPSDSGWTRHSGP